MAQHALQRHVRSGQSKAGGGVIEGGVRPRSCRMALLTRLRKSRRGVRWIVGRVEVVLMATDACRIGSGQAVITVHVTLHALQRGVRSRQGEAGGRVIEGCVAPRRGGVALLASLRECCLYVIWIGCSLEVLQMA